MKTYNKKLGIYAIVMGGFLASCAGTPPHLEMHKTLMGFEKGKTTQTEMLAALGEPEEKNKDSRGKDVWIYQREQPKWNDSNKKIADTMYKISFDDNKVMSNMNINSTGYQEAIPVGTKPMTIIKYKDEAKTIPESISIVQVPRNKQ